MKYLKFAFLCFGAAFSAASCVDKEYDLTKLNKEITVVENLTVPLGETAPITVKDLMDQDTSVAKYFSRLSDGTYSVLVRDSVDLSDNLAGLTDFGTFGGVDFSTEVEYKLEGLSPEAFSFPSIDKTGEFGIFSASSIPEDAFKFKLDDFVTEFDIRDSIPPVVPVIDLPEDNPLCIKLDETCQIINVNIEKPSFISSVDSVFFSDAKGIDVSLKLTGNSLPSGMNAKVKSFSLVFPKTIKAKGADASGRVTFSNRSLPLEETVNLEYLIPENSDKSIFFTADVDVEAEIIVWGSTPVSAITKPVGIAIGAGAELLVSDFSAVTKTGNYDLDIEPVKFTLEMPDGVADFGKMVLTPKGSPEFTFSLDIPETDMRLKTGADGMVVTFTEMLTIKENVPSGCTYDPLNRKLTVKGDLPKNLKLGIDHLTVAPFKDESGKYIADGEVNVSGNVLLEESRIHKKDVDAISKSKFGYYFKTDAIDVASIAFEKLSAKFEEEVSASLFKEGELPSEIVGIDEIVFRDTWFKVAMDCKGLPSVGSGKEFKVSLKAKLPDWVTPSEFEMNGAVKDNRLKADSVRIEKVVLSGMDLSKGVDFNAKVNLEISVDEPAIDVSTLSETIVASINGGIGKIDIEKIAAKLDYALEEMRQSIDLSGIFGNTDSKVDINLDIDNPYLMIDIASNVGIPVEFKADLLPYSNGAVVGKAKASFDGRYEKAAGIDKESHMKLFVAGKDEGRPGDYQFKNVSFGEILKAKPDSVVMVFSARTDKNESCVVLTDAKYRMTAGYEFGAPLKLGKDFEVAFRDTFDIASVAEYMQYADIAIIGVVENKMPFGLDLRLKLLDENGNEVALAAPAEARIESCNSDGSVRESAFDFNISPVDNKTAGTISKAALEFKLGSGEAAGVPVKEDSYIKAVLKLKLPDGITVDIDELTKKEDK